MGCPRLPIRRMRRRGLGDPQHSPGQQLRARPDFPVPADLQANSGPAARDVFKRATDSRTAWLACSAAFAIAILDSIGESNRLAIADSVTDTLNLTPRDIINAMTLLHGTVTGAEVDLIFASASEEETVIPCRPTCPHRPI
jgi:hypothetical protein